MMALMVGAAPVLGWSTRNYVQYGFFAPSSYAPLVKVAGAIESGVFNIGTTPNAALYNFYVLGRESVQYRQFHSQMSAGVSTITDVRQESYVSDLNQGLSEVLLVSASSNSPVVALTGFVRSFSWGLLFPRGQTFGGYPHRDSFEFLNSALRSNADELRAQGGLQGLPNFVYTAKQPDVFVRAYARLAALYAPIYPYLVLAAYLSVMVAMLAGNLPGALPGLLFFLNVAVHAYLGVPFGRYIQVIDMLLIFSIVAAVPEWRRLAVRLGVLLRKTPFTPGH